MATKPLKLIALDEDDLDVVSSHLQDAVVRVGEMAYVPSRKRFAAVLNRFDWEKATDRRRPVKSMSGAARRSASTACSAPSSNP